MTPARAIKHIKQSGVLLVFPIKNSKEPPSLWSAFYPRSRMRWDWNDDGADQRVVDLWHLREELSRSSEVVYGKWYQGRATFFSKPVFTSLLAVFRHLKSDVDFRSSEARKLFQALLEDSPQSVRVLKETTELTGRINESAFQRGLKELWMRLLVVGHGEIDDGAFPSLAIGATRWLFEEVWDEADGMPVVRAEALIHKALPETSPFRKFYDRTKRVLAPAP